MKRKVIVGIIVFALVCSARSFAASSGATIVEDDGHWSLGAEYNHIMEKKLSPNPQFISADIKTADFFYFKPAYGIYKNDKWNASLFGKLGEGNLKISAKEANSLMSEDIKYSHGFSWGLGAKSTYQHTEVFGISLNLEYNELYADIDEVSFQGQRNIGTTLTGDKGLKMSEFQMAVLFSATIKSSDSDLTYRPYVGPVLTLTDLSRGTIDYRTATATRSGIDGNAGEDSAIGVVAGLDVLTFVESLRLNLEFRFVTETAFTLSIHYQF